MTHSTPTKISSPSPYKSWEVRQTPGGTINPHPPTPIHKDLVKRGIQGNLIYRFKHTDSGRRYVGSSLQTLAGSTFHKRLLKYKQELKGPGRHIVNAIRRSPKKFSVKIVAHHPQTNERGLLNLEEHYQDQYDTRNRSHGYNHSRPTREPLRSRRRPAMRKAAKIALEKIHRLERLNHQV